MVVIIRGALKYFFFLWINTSVDLTEKTRLVIHCVATKLMKKNERMLSCLI